MLLYLSILSSLFFTVFAEHSNIKRHNALAQRKRDDVSLVKRGQDFSNVRATWYQTGLGGCGIWNNPSDYIVALNFRMFGPNYPGPQCFKKIKISYGGKTAIAQITDACEACPGNGGIDMSEGLFRYFADPAGGVISVDWSYVDGDEGGGDPAPKPKPTTKWQAPTPKWTPPAETTTHHTTHTTSTKTSHSSSSTHSSSSSTSTSAPAIATPGGANNIANLYQAVLGLANCAVAGASN